MEKIPTNAILARGYYKWTDSLGIFHKVPVDGSVEVSSGKGKLYGSAPVTPVEEKKVVVKSDD